MLKSLTYLKLKKDWVNAATLHWVLYCQVRSSIYATPFPSGMYVRDKISNAYN